MTYGRKTGGRSVGTPNKVTSQAKQVIGAFVEKNAPKLDKWLDEVANGMKDDNGKFIIPPNPGKAFQLYHSIMEYHVPKLGRIEVSGMVDDEAKVQADLGVFQEIIDGMRAKRQAEQVNSARPIQNQCR